MSQFKQIETTIKVYVRLPFCGRIITQKNKEKVFRRV